MKGSGRQRRQERFWSVQHRTQEEHRRIWQSSSDKKEEEEESPLHSQVITSLQGFVFSVAAQLCEEAEKQLTAKQIRDLPAWNSCHCRSSARAAFNPCSKPHLTWAVRRARGRWRGWAGWVCSQQPRRPQRVRRSLCRALLLSAAPTAGRHSWGGGKGRCWNITEFQPHQNQLNMDPLYVEMTVFQTLVITLEQI